MKSYTALTLLESMDGLKRWKVGDTIELDDEKAAILLDARAVVPLTTVETVKTDTPMEVAQTVETAVAEEHPFVRIAGTKTTKSETVR